MTTKELIEAVRSGDLHKIHSLACAYPVHTEENGVGPPTTGGEQFADAWQQRLLVLAQAIVTEREGRDRVLCPSKPCSVGCRKRRGNIDQNNNNAPCAIWPQQTEGPSERADSTSAEFPSDAPAVPQPSAHEPHPMMHDPSPKFPEGSRVRIIKDRGSPIGRLLLGKEAIITGWSTELFARRATTQYRLTVGECPDVFQYREDDLEAVTLNATDKRVPIATLRKGDELIEIHDGVVTSINAPGGNVLGYTYTLPYGTERVLMGWQLTEPDPSAVMPNEHMGENDDTAKAGNMEPGTFSQESHEPADDEVDPDAPVLLYTETKNVYRPDSPQAPGFGICAGVSKCEASGRSVLCRREVEDCPLQGPPPTIQQGDRDHCDGCVYQRGHSCVLPGLCTDSDARICYTNPEAMIAEDCSDSVTDYSGPEVAMQQQIDELKAQFDSFGNAMLCADTKQAVEGPPWAAAIDELTKRLDAADNDRRQLWLHTKPPTCSTCLHETPSDEKAPQRCQECEPILKNWESQWDKNGKRKEPTQ